jgi:hypothetical protein
MIREKVKTSDYRRISSEYPIYIWHFVQKHQAEVPFSIQSYFDDLETVYNKRSPLSKILEKINIPYFESYNFESIDFLMDLGFNSKGLYNPKPHVLGVDHYKHYTPLIVGFKNGQMISSTLDTCYCLEGTIDLISALDITLLEKVEF